ncbi:hypothetical protein EIN_359310 [Entamoeba invadens IP1]|uniref:Uncharacterized protein n=1 Tax=Entamoeba invadens IP1 TaxID=370355 RepID=A0A0A1U7L0_ENTIV|nr:hypothetical protein EIN_359310 [Entamoeba invadens IP1]ELP90848.1 hypothetical protein EIN_359310 [Entamoeba invadens IP1]|eukprot:XP_004257619.1 hypothetical protein EIN_359310 [Entamoeba invadens IP1]
MSANYKNFVLALQSATSNSQTSRVCEEALSTIKTNETNDCLVTEILQEIITCSSLGHSVDQYKFFVVSNASKSEILLPATQTFLAVVSPHDELYLLLHTNTLQLSLRDPFTHPTQTVCALKTLKMYVTKVTAEQYFDWCFKAIQLIEDRKNSKDVVILRSFISVLPLFKDYISPPQTEKIICVLIKLLSHKSLLIVEVTVAVLKVFCRGSSYPSVLLPLKSLLKLLTTCKPVSEISGITCPYIVSNILKTLSTFDKNKIELAEQSDKGEKTLLVVKKLAEKFSTNFENPMSLNIFIDVLKFLHKMSLEECEKVVLTCDLQSLRMSPNGMVNRAFLQIISYSQSLVTTFQTDILAMYNGSDQLTSVQALDLIHSNIQITVPPSLVLYNTYVFSQLEKAVTKRIQKMTPPLSPDIVISLLNLCPSRGVLKTVLQLPIETSVLLTTYPANIISRKYAIAQGFVCTPLTQDELLLQLSVDTITGKSTHMTCGTTHSVSYSQRVHEQTVFLSSSMKQ